MASSFVLGGQSNWNIFGTSFTPGGATFKSGDTAKLNDPAGVFGPFAANRDYEQAVLRVILADGSSDVVQVLASNGRNPLVPVWTGAIHFAASPVPEPGTWMLMFAGLGVLAGLARWKSGKRGRWSAAVPAPDGAVAVRLD